MKIVGYKESSFDTPDGKHISGVTFYVSFKSDSPNCYGIMTDKVFISENKLAGQQYDIGYTLNPVYNKFGKIQSVSFTK